MKFIVACLIILAIAIVLWLTGCSWLFTPPTDITPVIIKPPETLQQSIWVTLQSSGWWNALAVIGIAGSLTAFWNGGGKAALSGVLFCGLVLALNVILYIVYGAVAKHAAWLGLLVLLALLIAGGLFAYSLFVKHKGFFCLSRKGK